MTDNEKRAHDLTILYMYSEIKDGTIVTVSENIQAVSFVSEYQNIYDSILKVIETSDEI